MSRQAGGRQAGGRQADGRHPDGSGGGGSAPVYEGGEIETRPPKFQSADFGTLCKVFNGAPGAELQYEFSGRRFYKGLE